MPRGSDLVGLSVLAGPKLKRIGRVQEVLLNVEGTHICGLVLDGGGWLSPRRVLDYQAVTAVGDGHVLAAEEQYLVNDGKAHCCQDLQGLPVLRRTGEEMGTLDDFQFDPTNGRVTALQLSRGFVDDLLRGKESIAVNGPVYAGEAAILLDGPGELYGGAGDEVSEL